jgi:spoIIIJ-associated protein
VEWVETTGKTIAEAIEAALDRLGVSESDAEVVVLEEPRNAIFGLRRSSARVRARVRPVQARAKRPSRRPPGGGSAESRSRRTGAKREAPSAANASARAVGSDGDSASRPRSRSERSPRQRPRTGGDRSRQGSANQTAGNNRSPSNSEGTRGSHRPERDEQDGSTPAVSKEEEMSIDAQAELAEAFVRGVVEGFGVEATVETSIDDDVIHVRVTGEGLGLLVGPRGATVDALQELTRTAVQHRSKEHAGRIHVDVAGYRARRAAALTDFARRVATEVVSTGQPQALEPMNAVDRKVVHDAVTEVPGAATSSEGEDPRRYVVIRPGSSEAAGVDVDENGDETDETTAEPARS